MRKPKRKDWNTLAQAWDEYGHQYAWDDLVDIKSASTHYFVALAWREQDGMINYATLASGDKGKTWEMQNDSHMDVTENVWNKARVVPDCDWLDIDRSAP